MEVLVFESGSNANIESSENICLATFFFNEVCYKVVVIDISS